MFWTLLNKQELAEKGIEEYGRFLKTSEIFEANPWEATECSGNRIWVGRAAGPFHPHDNPAYMQSEFCENAPRNLLPGYFSGYLCARKELEITQWEEWTGRAWTMLHWGNSWVIWLVDLLYLRGYFGRLVLHTPNTGETLNRNNASKTTAVLKQISRWKCKCIPWRACVKIQRLRTGARKGCSSWRFFSRKFASKRNYIYKLSQVMSYYKKVEWRGTRDMGGFLRFVPVNHYNLTRLDLVIIDNDVFFSEVSTNLSCI